MSFVFQFFHLLLDYFSGYSLLNRFKIQRLIHNPDIKRYINTILLLKYRYDDVLLDLMNP